MKILRILFLSLQLFNSARLYQVGTIEQITLPNLLAKFITLFDLFDSLDPR